MNSSRHDRLCALLPFHRSSAAPLILLLFSCSPAFTVVVEAVVSGKSCRESHKSCPFSLLLAVAQLEDRRSQLVAVGHKSIDALENSRKRGN